MKMMMMAAKVNKQDAIVHHTKIVVGLFLHLMRESYYSWWFALLEKIILSKTRASNRFRISFIFAIIITFELDLEEGVQIMFLHEPLIFMFLIIIIVIEIQIKWIHSLFINIFWGKLNDYSCLSTT
ncbi:hypothetical protein ACJX0J_024781 [Zea mays]